MYSLFKVGNLQIIIVVYLVSHGVYSWMFMKDISIDALGVFRTHELHKLPEDNNKGLRLNWLHLQNTINTGIH